MFKFLNKNQKEKTKTVYYEPDSASVKNEVNKEETNQQNQLNIKPEIKNPNIELISGKTNLIDMLSPKTIDVDFNYIKINNVYYRTLFVSGYPRFVTPGWLEPIINFNSSIDISFYIYPIGEKSVLDNLRRKITEMEAEIATDIERGKLINSEHSSKT